MSREAKQLMAAAQQAKAEANAVSALTCAPLVSWAKRTVLETLNVPAPLSTLHDGTHDGGARGACHAELTALLGRTLDGIENVSSILVGPRGAGKHRLLSAVLRQIGEADARSGGSGGFLRVDLHPQLVPDEPTALMAIASQLRVMHSALSTRGSFCDGLRYLLHLLRRARPGGAGDDAIEGQSQPVVFVLHAFEEFTLRPKQTLLYSMFDLMQTEDAQMAVIGLTTRIDVADLLEKRVRSRCSQRQMWLPALDSTASCARLLASALALPEVAPGETVSVGATAEQTKRFRRAWEASLKCICAQLPHSPALRRRLSCGITPSQVSTALRLCMAELSHGRPKSALLTVDAFDAALRLLVTPRHEKVLGECSVVELLLLICIKKLADKELPPPHTLKMALREYAVFCASGGPGGAQYDYPKPLLYKSFEHLCALGLVSTEGGGGRARQPVEQLPLRLCTDPQTLHEYIRSHNELPLQVQRFGTQWTT